jgi:predicted component of type VI protein secretion system
MAAQHRVDTLDSLLSRLAGETASLADIEDAVALLRRYRFTTVSARLFRLADAVRELLEDDPALAAEVREIARRKEAH